jgi:hypothetical protein
MGGDADAERLEGGQWSPEVPETSQAMPSWQDAQSGSKGPVLFQAAACTFSGSTAGLRIQSLFQQ